MLTIYFDTNFYVDLAWAEENAADEILSALNALDVRGVFSHNIMREMLPNTHHPERDELLVERMRCLKGGFLYLDEGTWDWLLLTGEVRRKARGEILSARAQMDLAESWSASANKPMTDEEAEHMVTENRDQFAAMGLLDNEGNLNPLGGINMQRQVIESLPLPAAMKNPVLEMMELAEKAVTASQAERERFNEEIQVRFRQFQEIASRLAPDVPEKVNTRNDIFRNDDRPKDIVLNRNREKRLKRVSNSYRDAGHIGRFIANSDQIDFLQIDGPNYRRFTDPATKNSSRLDEMGLLDRCFAVSKLGEVVPRIRDLRRASERRNLQIYEGEHFARDRAPRRFCHAKK